MIGDDYVHWQPGYLIRAVVGAGLVLVVATTIRLWSGPLPAVVLLPVIVTVGGLLAAGLIAFHGLGTEIAGEYLRVWFGPGWIERRVPLNEIRRVARVRNSWWMGWGIRWIDAGTTLWNVSGLDAVELELRSGRRFRVGTDDPEGLGKAIRSSLEQGGMPGAPNG